MLNGWDLLDIAGLALALVSLVALAYFAYAFEGKTITSVKYDTKKGLPSRRS